MSKTTQGICSDSVRDTEELLCRIEKQLSETREKYKDWIDNLAVGVFRNTPGHAGHILEANPAMIKMFEAGSKRELLSHNVSELYKDPHKRKEISDKILKDGMVKNEEIQLKTLRGRVFWASVTAILRRDEEGNMCFDGIVEDISERKRIEKALRDSEEQYRITINSMNAAIHVVDNKLRFILFNSCFKKWCRRLGLETDVIGKTVFDAFPFLSPKVLNEYRYVFKTGKIFTSEECNKLKDKVIVTETQKIPVFEEKRVIRVVTVVRDITERKKIDNALRKSEEEFRLAFENAKDAIFWADPKTGLIVKCNRAAENLLERRREEIEDEPHTLLHPAYKKRCYARMFKKHIQQKGAVDEEAEVVTKSGRIKPVHITAAITSVGGRTKIQGVFRDITERKQAQERTRLLNKELFRTNKKLKQLALIDSTTKLYNHRYLTDHIEVEFQRARRYNSELSVIMLDLDYFKSVNDIYGHEFGDLVLVQLAKLLKKIVRTYDMVIRFGGEEFVIVSPGIDRNSALNLAQRILNTFNLYNFGNRKHTVKLKLSIAVASYPEDRIIKGINLIEIAESILNKVKELGGNRVLSSLDIKEEKQMTFVSEGYNDIILLQEKIHKLTKRTNESLIEAIFAFAKAIELKDHYTGEHVERTVQYSTGVAKALGLSKEEIEHIRQASVLHDLGKIGISEKILRKKKKLNFKERDEIRRHPQIAADILRPIHFLHSIIPLILHHHARWDGRGYPDNLKREDIPIGARIIAIADVYQALISDRPYRKAFTREQAVKIIRNGSGTQFDPHIVNVFVNILNQE